MRQGKYCNALKTRHSILYGLHSFLVIFWAVSVCIEEKSIHTHTHTSVSRDDQHHGTTPSKQSSGAGLRGATEVSISVLPRSNHHQDDNSWDGNREKGKTCKTWQTSKSTLSKNFLHSFCSVSKGFLPDRMIDSSDDLGDYSENTSDILTMFHERGFCDPVWDLMWMLSVSASPREIKSVKKEQTLVCGCGRGPLAEKSTTDIELTAKSNSHGGSFSGQQTHRAGLLANTGPMRLATWPTHGLCQRLIETLLSAISPSLSFSQSKFTSSLTNAPTKYRTIQYNKGQHHFITVRWTSHSNMK